MSKNPTPTPPPVLVNPATVPRVVGVVHDLDSLRAGLAVANTPAAPDLLELRADGFAGTKWQPQWQRNLPHLPELKILLRHFDSRWILTVRDPREGGLRTWLTPARRAEFLAEFLKRDTYPGPAYVDVELRNLRRLPHPDRTPGAPGFIASFHDFHGTPTVRRLRELAGQACALRADVFKAAARLRHPGDLARLLEFLHVERRLPLAVMGMGGALGLASRPVLAAAGSVLNYGYLGPAPAVPGQWPVAELRARIDELIRVP